MSSTVRRASHAGSWYQSDGQGLSSQLSDWLSRASPVGLPARAIIAPHAGYSYSGPCAAHAYRQIDPNKVNRIFILGPSHHVYIKGCALTGTSTYQTPLYDLTIDTQVVSDLNSTGHFQWMDIHTDEDEHSIEMHLPYVAKVMSSKRGQFTVVPILVGSQSPDQHRLYGEVFAKYLSDPSNFFIISSDFCHWGRRFSYTHISDPSLPIHKSIESLDKMGMELIETLDAAAFHNYLKQHQNTICGRHPISIMLNTVQAMKRLNMNGHKIEFKFLNYAQSNACTSKSDSSVSYAAGVLTFC